MQTDQPILIEIDDNVAIVRARPGCAPMLGVACLAVGSLAVFLLMGGLENQAAFSWLAYAGAWSIGALLFFAALLILHHSRYPIARFSGRSRTAEIVYWRPLRNRRVIPWDQILAVATTARTSKDGETEFGLTLILRSGDKLRLTSRNYPNGAACDDAARALNRFLTNA